MRLFLKMSLKLQHTLTLTDNDMKEIKCVSLYYQDTAKREKQNFLCHSWSAHLHRQKKNYITVPVLVNDTQATVSKYFKKVKRVSCVSKMLN